MKIHLTPAAACLLTVVAASSAAADAVVLEKHTVRDTAAVNQDAVSFLKPRGWKAEGSIRWYPDAAHQACVEVKFTSPDGFEQFETLPYVNFCWLTNAPIQFPRGYNYAGTIIHEPIEDLKEVVRRITLPSLRRGKNARIVGYAEMPEVAKAVAREYQGAKLRSGRVRVEYELNGQAVEEDFYLTMYTFTADLGWNAKTTLWGPAWTPFALRAPKGKLDAATPMLLAMANSAQVNPKWFAEYKYVCDLFVQRMNNAVRNAAELSRYIARNNDEIVKMYSESYRLRSESQDRISRNFSNYIRGVEHYESPFENHHVQLPSGYNYAWTNPSGEYILSNEANFNPNIGSNKNWQQMKVAR